MSYRTTEENVVVVYNQPQGLSLKTACRFISIYLLSGPLLYARAQRSQISGHGDEQKGRKENLPLT